MKNDINLMNRIRLGDEKAFSQLVEEFLASAYKTAYLVLRSKEMAEDAVQTALEDCYISIMRNKEIRNFKAWFYRLVYLRSIDLYRKNSRQQAGNIDENPEALAALNSASAQQQAIQNENTKEMLGMITSLNEEQSVPMLLYYYEGFSVKEISLILNENPNTIKTRLSRGRKKLAEMMQKNNEYPLEVKTYGV
ncbi:RNA polymerase sigma factor [Peribacillus glennii]|uniref:RNA polymerase sigma factor n=1 Tax=Peribacillus glennii TaxID=2303991 RepID=A0A372LJQ9_9BACI|nr:RNA polymerase sigma factor [Peribacillus glennii]RFU66724.1 RNA polymerase sigma factor [Peribacillus glennii]